MEVYSTTTEFLARLIWPGIVFIGVYWFRRPIERAIEAMANKLNDPTTDVSIGKSGLQLKRSVKAKLGEIEALRTELDRVKQQVDALLNKTAEKTGAETPALVLSEFEKLVTAYESVRAESLSERVRLKDRAANALTNFAIENNLNRDQVAGSGGNGRVVALAGVISADPRSHDATKLAGIALNCSWLHTRYRVALAIIRLAGMRLVDDGTRRDLLRILKTYREQGADRPLLEVICALRRHCV